MTTQKKSAVKSPVEAFISRALRWSGTPGHTSARSQGTQLQNFESQKSQNFYHLKRTPAHAKYFGNIVLLKSTTGLLGLSGEP